MPSELEHSPFFIVWSLISYCFVFTPVLIFFASGPEQKCKARAALLVGAQHSYIHT